MKQKWRIVEFKPGLFRLEQKTFIFWEPPPEYFIYRSLIEAKKDLLNMMEETKFTPSYWYF